jgi:hypothetical protein
MRILTYSQLHFSGFEAFHSLFGLHCILSSDHLDKGVAFVRIDDACLHNPEVREYCPQSIFG